MIDSMCLEIQTRSETFKHKIQSLYFGGGTPSLLEHNELSHLMETLNKRFDLTELQEVTLEANPDDIHPANLKFWKKHRINRLSIGIQSFKQADLAWMNRAHTVEESLDCVNLARSEGFDNISVDLMYGLPGLELGEWQTHIDKVIAMDVEHISAYCLTIEPKTALNHLIKSGKIVPAGEDQQSEQFELLSEKLSEAGFDHYEISNFGKPGKYALHNSNYWLGKPYLGIGPSAHSFDGTTRRWNVANNAAYMNMIGDQWYETETLSPKDRWNELLLTGLRTSFGVDENELYKLFTPSQSYLKKVSEFESAGWLIKVDHRLILTMEGRLKADHIASELFI